MIQNLRVRCKGPIVVAAALVSMHLLGASASAVRGPDFTSDLTLVQQAPPPATRLSSTQGSRFSRSAEAEIRFQEGLLRYNTGRLQQAENDFKAVLAADPADPEAYYYLGLSQLDQKRPADAVDSFTQALRIDPSFEEIYDARARAYLRLGRFDEAEQDINQLRNPKFENEVHYLRGLLAYGRNDLETARREFAAAKTSGGVESTAAGFYEGLTYLRMRELVQARSAFRDSALINTDPTLAAASRQLDTVLAIQEGGPKRPWDAQVTIAYEYDSNVIQIGSGIPLPGGISNQSDSRFVIQPSGSYSFIDKDPWEVGIEGNGYFSWYLDLSDFDIASFQLGPFLNWHFSENWFFSARYGYNYVQLGHEPYLNRNIITPQLTYIEKNFGYTSAYFQFESRQFDEATPTPALDRDGQIYAIGIVQGINLPPIFRDAGPANLDLSYRFEDQVAQGSDFDGLFHTLSATIFVPLPVWKLRADLGLSVAYDGYTNANSLDDEGRDREDWEYNITVGLSRQINKYFTVRADYTYTDHDSNVKTGGVDPYSYDRSQAGVRLIITF
ncbi:MAG: tetratricopeptide repeat protein [Anaerolineae bacterium]|nr:tetratricopeptide repeat protein [Phycisphaerae bacterium]